MKYKLAIEQYFKTMNLKTKKWDIVANDGTTHPFTNYNVIEAIKGMGDEALVPILDTLQKCNGDRVAINGFLKKVALEFCNNRIGVIQALVEDYSKSQNLVQKKHFANALNHFPVNDIKKAGVFKKWLTIKEKHYSFK